MAELEGKTLGKYHLVEKIGRGGMSNIYKAIDLRSEQTVAVKVLAPHLNLDESFKVRFSREAQVLAQLQHPNIIPIIDFGDEDGLMFIVMPYMRVGGLHLRLQQGAMSVKEGMRIIEQMSCALQYAHDMGVVHRDVKPSNILLDEAGNAYLSDFGFAHVMDATMSLTGSAVIGTPAYMSPEQIQGARVTPRSDQYSLGVVLYRMSTGYLPYDAETPIAIALKHATDPLPRPRKINPNLPENIEWVLLKALSKEPKNRYKSVSDFNHAFQAAIQETVQATREGRQPRHITKILPPEMIQLPVQSELTSRQIAPDRRLRRKFPLPLAFALLLLIPFAFWALVSGLPGLLDSQTRVALQSPDAVDLGATLDAYATEIVAISGVGLSQDMLQTLIAGTLTAQSGTQESLPMTGEETTTSESAGGGDGATESGAPASETPITPGVFNTPGEATSKPNDSSGGESADPSATSTSVPSSTPVGPGQPSATPTIPAQTATQTSPAVIPSNTPSSPSQTPISPPTDTPLPPPTNAPVPPSNTPLPPPPTATTENVCSKLSVGGKSVQNKKVSWNFKNNSSVSVTISLVRLSWPDDPGNTLLRIKVGSKNYSVNDGSSPSEKSGVGVAVSSGGSVKIQFEFNNSTNASSYSVTVKTSNGCSK